MEKAPCSSLLAIFLEKLKIGRDTRAIWGGVPKFPPTQDLEGALNPHF